MNNVLLKKISKAVVKEIQALEEQVSDQGVEEIISEIEIPPEVEKKVTGEDPQQTEEPQEKQQQSTVSPKDLEASKEILQKHEKLVVNITDFIEQYKEGEWEKEPIEDIIDLAQDTIQEDLKGEIQKFAASKKWNEVIPLMNKLVDQRYAQLLQIKKQGADKSIDIKGYLQPMVAFMKAYNQLKEIINKLSEQPPEQPEEKPTDVKDTPVEDMYDASNKEKITLEQAFIEFKENFYQVNQLRLQGSMIKNLMKALKDIQDSQKKDQAQPFKKVQESINEQAIPKKALENIKTDIRALYQKILSTKKLMNAAAGAADKGKANFRFLRKELLDELEQVQEYILEVYNDLASLNPQQVNEQSETLKQMNLDAEKVQAVYNDVLKKVGPIVDVLLKDEKVSEKQLIPVVDEILQRLEKIADLFPSVKTFAGQTGEFAQLQGEYIQAIRTMSALNDNFQNIIKDESISSVSARELYRGMQKFSSEIERLFGVPSRIENKPAPEVAMVEPDEEEETEATPEDAEEEKPQGIKLPKVVNELPAIRAAIKPNLFNSFTKALRIDATTSGEAGRRLRQQYNSFIRYYLMLKAVSEALQEVAPLGGTKAMEIAGVSDERITKTLNFLKSDSKQDYENIVTLFNQQDPRELRMAFRLVDLYFKRQGINPKPSTKDYRKILDIQFIPLEKINEQKIIEVLRPIIKSTLKEL